jgi:hypothetical protein
MFALIFSGYGLLALDKSPTECKMNNQYFCDVVLEEAQRSVTPMTGKSGIEGLMIQMDNCQVHDSRRTAQRFEGFRLIRFIHPPYSPTSYRATSVFWAGARR